MSKISKRHFLKSREAQKLINEIGNNINVAVEDFFGKNPRIEFVESEGIKVFMFNSKPLLAVYKDKFVPTLIFREALDVMPKVIVDMGAVPHICNGADVMAPGITEVEGTFHEGDIVVVLDEKNRKSIAVGVALKNSEEIVGAKRGKVVKNIHFVGDRLWKLIKSL